ncbi:glycosyltransferase [Paenibacillus sp. GCM10012307]|uniref:Glycosyltransferase n=1 Tax=Paenibacillus roseus TaxID=2798579 RepID=A0A934J3R7_9BACL|nr:glycosyltransferase [Paenibacillus roseus]MBJ6360963.1 glycosyltransferase [Paenibacillus roseus]
MNHSAPAAIQQQMYTRERRGVFRSTEGYDTIAKSAGLDGQLIKKQIHPLCIYDAPAALTASGEKDESAYPAELHLLKLDNGDLLLGRSVYKAADFTGLRSTFFTHHYVIPGSRWDSGEIGYKDILRASFAAQYDMEQGEELPTLETLPLQAANEEPVPPRALLSELNLGERRFGQLLYAAMSAVHVKKKVYIALDVPIEQISEKAAQLLELLYAALPLAFRRQLGFLTYAKEPQSKKSIHLTFVERGSLRPGDRNIEKEFIFDLENDRIVNTDIDAKLHAFLEFAWSNLEQPERMADFFEFAERMLPGMEPERELSIGSYDELTILFQLEAGQAELYELHKSAILRSMMDYLSSASALTGKVRLNDLYLSCFDREFDRVRQGSLPEVFVAENFRDYYRLDGKHSGNKIVAYFIHTLTHAQTQGSKQTADPFYEVVASEPALSQAFFGRVMSDVRLCRLLFMPYLGDQLQKTKSVQDALALAEKWAEAYPVLYELELFHELVRTQVAEKLRPGSWLLEKTSKFLDEVRRRKEAGGVLSYGELNLLEGVEFAAYCKLMSVLQLSTVTRQQLLEALFLSWPDQLRVWNAELNEDGQRLTAAKLLAAYRWVTQPGPGPELLSGLSADAMDEVQELGRQMLASEADTASFESMILAFYRSPELEVIQYSELIDFLRHHAKHKETLYSFFRWSEQHPDFMRPRGFVPAYRTVVMAYFKKYDRDAFKKRANVKRYFSKAGPHLQDLYNQVRLELSSPLMRLFRQNSKLTWLSVLLAAGIILTVGGVWLAGGEGPAGGKTGAGAAVSPSDSSDTGAGQGDRGETAIQHFVYAEGELAKGVENAIALVFPFEDAAACTAFKPDQLTIVSPDGPKLELKGLKYASACATTGEDAQPQGEESAAPLGELPYKVSVQLSEPLAIPLNSIIQVQDTEFVLAAAPDSEQDESKS